MSLRAFLVVALLGLMTAHAQLPAFNNIDTDWVIIHVAARFNPQFAALDPPILLRIATVLNQAWFDALAPYHPTAVGVSSRIARQPAGATLRSKNIASLYASFRVANSVLPSVAQKQLWRNMLTDIGFNPDLNFEYPNVGDGSADSIAIAIGNRAGNGVVADRERDGMNQLGDLDLDGDVRKYNFRPYFDYTGFEPTNDWDDLRDKSAWQPLVENTPVRNGGNLIQKYVTPQYGRTRPYTIRPRDYTSPRPTNSSWSWNPRSGYRRQVDEVLDASAGLTDVQKMTAELFDNKLGSLGISTAFAGIITHPLDLSDFVILDFMQHVAAFDAGIACWKEKTRWNAIRPVSAIRAVYGERKVTAWGGPGKGTVNDLPADEWRSYLRTADHPEYPSGSSCFCSAHSQAGRRFNQWKGFPVDSLGMVVNYAAGSSVVEPGVTPAAPLSLSFPTWSDFDFACGLSRWYGGVHFLSSIQASKDMCKGAGDEAFEFVKRHVLGTV